MMRKVDKPGMAMRVINWSAMNQKEPVPWLEVNL